MTVTKRIAVSLTLLLTLATAACGGGSGTGTETMGPDNTALPEASGLVDPGATDMGESPSAS